MFLRQCLSVVLWLVTSALCPAPGALTLAGQQDDAKRPAQEKPAADAQQKPSTPVPTAPEQAKPKRVITNDDLLQGFNNEGLGLSPAEFNEVNNCDRSCFEYLRQSARIDSGDARWRRKVLQAVDLVRKDPEWQKILHEIYDLHFKLCDLADQEREELNRDGDPRNVTRQQISIEEKYEARLKDLQEQLRAVQARQSALVSKANDNLIAYRFRIYQENRVQNAACAQRTYPNYPQNDPDDR